MESQSDSKPRQIQNQAAMNPAPGATVSIKFDVFYYVGEGDEIQCQQRYLGECECRVKLTRNHAAGGATWTAIDREDALSKLPPLDVYGGHTHSLTITEGERLPSNLLLRSAKDLWEGEGREAMYAYPPKLDP